MRARTERARNPGGSGQFCGVALAVIDAQRMTGIALAQRPGEGGRRIEPAGEKDDGVQRRAARSSRCFALAAAGLAG